jgi:hypothetical protein
LRSSCRHKKKARKQREKEAAEGATTDGSYAQQLVDPNGKNMTKKQRKAKIAAGVVADDSSSEEEVGVDVDAANEGIVEASGPHDLCEVRASRW